MQTMAEKLLAFIPNFVGAGLILGLGWIIATVAQRAVTSTLQAAQADRFAERFGLAEVTGETGIPKFAGVLVFTLLIIPIAIAALDALDMRSISEPAQQMLTSLLNAIPNVFAAAIVILLAFIIGSLAPDIDGEGSITRPGKILWRFVGPAIGNLLDAIFELFSAVLKLFFSHRGFIHSPFLACCIIGLGFVLDRTWLMWFGGGFAAHLLGDAMTSGGIPVWSPVSSRRLSMLDMRTGSKREHMVAVTLLVFTCVFGWGLLPEAVKDTHRMIYEAAAKQ